MTIGCSLIGMFPDNEILPDETSERKSNNVPEVGCGLSRRSTDRKTPGKSPPIRDIARHQPDFTGSRGSLAIDVKWQLLCPDDGKIYPRRVELQIHQSLRRAPAAL